METARLPVIGGGRKAPAQKSGGCCEESSREKSATRNTARTHFPKLGLMRKETRCLAIRWQLLPTRRGASAAPSVEGVAMNRNRRANAGPVATTGNGTYGQFYQRDASGSYPGDLRTTGVGGVPGRRVPPATGASPGANASAAPGRGQPFAATSARVAAPTGTSARPRRTNPNRALPPPPPPRVGRALLRRPEIQIRQFPRRALLKLPRPLIQPPDEPPSLLETGALNATAPRGKRAVASIVRTSRDAPSATASSSEHAHAPSSIDPLVRRTINQLSRQTSDAPPTVDAATGAATARKHRTSSSSSFDATTAMPRRKSPEETASQRPAWDTRATSRDGRVGGGARLAANLNSFADAAAMRRDPSPARAAFANKTGDRAAACAYASGESPGGEGPRRRTSPEG